VICANVAHSTETDGIVLCPSDTMKDFYGKTHHEINFGTIHYYYVCWSYVTCFIMDAANSYYYMSHEYQHEGLSIKKDGGGMKSPLLSVFLSLFLKGVKQILVFVQG